MPAQAAWREIWPGPGDKARKALGRVRQNLRSEEGQVRPQIIQMPDHSPHCRGWGVRCRREVERVAGPYSNAKPLKQL